MTIITDADEFEKFALCDRAARLAANRCASEGDDDLGALPESLSAPSETRSIGPLGLALVGRSIET